jgi:hypothetical protein
MTRFLILAGLIAMIAPANVGAQRVPPFTIGQEPACQRAIGRGARGFVRDLLTGWGRCYQDEGAGRGDCTSLDTAKSELSFRRKVTSSPCRSLTTFADLGLGPTPTQALDVLIETLIRKARELADLVYAPYAGGAQALQRTDVALFRCLRGVTAETKKLAITEINEDAVRCIDRDDALQVKHPERLPACDEAKRVAKLDAARVKALSHIETQCAGRVDAAALVQATEAAADLAVCRSYPRAKNRNICPPSFIYLKTVGGRIDLGWRGGAHDQAVTETLPLTIEMSSCIGNDQTTCDLFSALAGQVKSVIPSDSVCLVRRHTGDLTGTITFTGTPNQVDYAKLNTPAMFDIHLPVTVQVPCPTCSGAALGEAGTCQGGASDGQPCVVDGDYGAMGRTSSSCLPTLGTRITGLYPQMDGTSTEEHRLDATYPCQFFGVCHCPDQAYADECWNEEDPTCNPDGTCAADLTPCFPSTIVRTGTASPFVTAGIGCIPRSASAAIDTIVGIPGPMAVELEWEFVDGP